MAVPIPNGIDTSVFRPGTRSDVWGLALTVKSILLVGNPNLPLKGFDVALAALKVVKQFLPFQLGVVWVLQKLPEEPFLTQVPPHGWPQHIFHVIGAWFSTIVYQNLPYGCSMCTETIDMPPGITFHFPFGLPC